MTNRKELVERRKHKRFRVPRNVFVAARPHYNIVGRLTDIGMDGLSFRYMNSGEPSNKSFELDIFLADGHFYLENVPCETISDLETYESPFGSVTTRQCAVQFGGLKSHQKAQLEYLIKNHTIGEA